MTPADRAAPSPLSARSPADPPDESSAGSPNGSPDGSPVTTGSAPGEDKAARLLSAAALEAARRRLAQLKASAPKLAVRRMVNSEKLAIVYERISTAAVYGRPMPNNYALAIAMGQSECMASYAVRELAVRGLIRLQLNRSNHGQRRAQVIGPGPAHGLSTDWSVHVAHGQSLRRARPEKKPAAPTMSRHAQFCAALDAAMARAGHGFTDDPRARPSGKVAPVRLSADPRVTGSVTGCSAATCTTE